MERREYDYVIIGAGIAGLSAGYHLGKDGYNVLVLEANDGKGSASYASTAEMNHDPDAHWEKVTSHFGLEGARKLWELCAEGIDLLSEFAHQRNEKHFGTGRVPAYLFSYRATDTDVLQDKYQFYKSIGAYVSLNLTPAIHPNFRTVLTIHGEGVTNNQSLLANLAHEVREQGGEILHGQRVMSLDDTFVHTESGVSYFGKQIIIATGDGGGLVPASFAIERKRTFVISYEKHEMPELFRTSVLWDTDSPYHYIRSFAGNRIWIGGEDVYEHDYMSSAEEDEKKYLLLQEYAHAVLGIDATYVSQAAWNALFFPTKRGLPYIGEIPGMHHIASTGFGGTGIITSFLSGYLLAAWRRGELLEYQPLFAMDWE